MGSSWLTGGWWLGWPRSWGEPCWPTLNVHCCMSSWGIPLCQSASIWPCHQPGSYMEISWYDGLHISQRGIWLQLWMQDHYRWQFLQCHPTGRGYQVTEGLLIFLLKWVPLVPGWKSEMGLNKVMKLVYCWHEHGVHVNLAGKCRHVRNSQGKVKMTGLSSLARVACRNKPLDIFI